MELEKLKKRDKERTKTKILKAVGTVIENYGTEKVGVNLIARTAGVNKVLIYRYFNSVDGLMEQYVKSGEYSSTTSDNYLLGVERIAEEERQTALTELMIGLMNDLRERKATRDILRWEIATGKSLLANTKNMASGRLLQIMGQLPNYSDSGALATLIVAGIYYLSISADYREHIVDINLQSKDDWNRIEKLIRDIIVSIKG